VEIVEINTHALFLTIAICVLAFPAYPQSSGSFDYEKADSYSCVPPSTYMPHPGDPPFGKYVQTTARYLNKDYLFGILYCQDGTFEFIGSDQSTISLEGTIYRTGSWWWQDDKSCTEIDAADTDTGILSARCKEPGHWLGNHKVSVRSSGSSMRRLQ
jgi:hypothetical protein